MTTDPTTINALTPRFDRMALLTALAGLGMLVTLIAYFYTRIAFPGDGAPIVDDLAHVRPEGLFVHPIVPRLGELKTGDVVAAVQEHSVDELLIANFGALASPVTPGGQSYIYTVLREGMPRGVRVTLGPYPLARAIAEDWALCLFIVYMAALSTFVFIHRPDVPAARIFFRLSLAVLVSQLIYALSYQTSDLLYGWLVPFLVVTNLVLWFYALSGGLHFSLNFPRLQPLLQRRAALWVFIYAGPWLVYLLLMGWLAPAATTAAALLQVHFRATAPVGGLYFVLMFIGFVMGFRSSPSTKERRQLRWVVWGTAIAFFPWILILILSPLFGTTPRAALPVLGISFMALPTAVAIAILREQLFDIDVIIRRTVTYALVTTLLLVIFFGSIILLQQLFANLTGSAQNELVTVLSTLAIAALFVPVRNRVQGLIDRRFNRKKYDAQQVLARFGETVRDETDLEKLTSELVNVVQETMQPKNVSLWLRKDRTD